MPRSHVVQAGENLSAIALASGFADGARILGHPDNSALSGRPHPGLLDEGESLTIPDPSPKSLSLATGNVHAIVAQRPTAKLKVAFKTFRGGATVATTAQVAPTGGAAQAVTLSSGAFEIPVDPRCPSALVTVPPLSEGQPELRWRLAPGYLRRSETDAGALARLRNLGYYRAVSGAAEAREVRSAVEEFQCDQNLKLTGALDDATKAKIAEVHGC